MSYNPPDDIDKLEKLFYGPKKDGRDVNAEEINRYHKYFNNPKGWPDGLNISESRIKKFLSKLGPIKKIPEGNKSLPDFEIIGKDICVEVKSINTIIEEKLSETKNKINIKNEEKWIEKINLTLEDINKKKNSYLIRSLYLGVIYVDIGQTLGFGKNIGNLDFIKKTVFKQSTIDGLLIYREQAGGSYNNQIPTLFSKNSELTYLFKKHYSEDELRIEICHQNKATQNIKETEIGKIPEEWEVKELGEVCQLVKKQYSPSKSDVRAYIGLEHIEQQNLKLICTGSSEDIDSNKFEFKAGQILFGKLRPYFRKVYRPKFDGVCSTDIWVIDSKGQFDNGFLFYFLADQRIINEASNSSEGTRMPRARWDYLSRLSFAFPSIVEQRAIASILGTLDDKLVLNRSMNSTLEAIGQALFKHWFVELEFPDEGGKPYRSSGGEMVDSELGEVPKGWVVKPIDKIADFLNGLALQKYPPKGESFLPVIKIRELRQGTTESSDKASSDVDKKYIVEDGDILFSWSGSLEVCIWCGGRGALNQHLFKVTSQNYPKWFYYQWIKIYLPEFQHIAEGKATTMGHIQRYHLSNSLVVVPPNEIIEKANKLMNPLIERYINNAVESRNLSKIRDALLPKLMSGQIRVPVEVRA